MGTVHNIVGRLRAIFKARGMGGTFDEYTQQGNPAASLAVSAYVDATRLEQSAAHACPRQAVPMFADKLELIASYIDRQLDRTLLSVRQRFVFLRDQALLKFAFFSGDRLTDAGLTLTQAIKFLPAGQGLLIKHTTGKTFRLDRPNEFSLHRCENILICPVQGVEQYIHQARLLSVDLRFGYLFRPVSPAGCVLNEPLSYSSFYDRLKSYLTVLGIHQGETPHGLRGGCAITLACTEGAPGGDIMEHVGWSTRSSMQRYTRVSQLIDGTSVAAAMSRSVVTNPTYPAQLYSQLLNSSSMPPAFS